MADRRTLLRRIERLRSVERHDALAALARTRAEHARMEEVARRSRALAGDGVLASGVNDGAALAAALAFHARLAGLVGEAERLGARAGAMEAVARAGFAEADRRLERVRERRVEADRMADGAVLARSLLNSGQKPRGAR